MLGKKRKMVKIIGYSAIGMGIGGAMLGLISILTGGEVFLAISGITYGIMGSLMGYVSITREFTIYEKGILYPKGFGRKFIPFSNIWKIVLNAKPEDFKMKIEIYKKDGYIESIPKNFIPQWNEFYRVMTEDLKDKVCVEL